MASVWDWGSGILVFLYHGFMITNLVFASHLVHIYLGGRTNDDTSALDFCSEYMRHDDVHDSNDFDVHGYIYVVLAISVLYLFSFVVQSKVVEFVDYCKNPRASFPQRLKVMFFGDADFLTWNEDDSTPKDNTTKHNSVALTIAISFVYFALSWAALVADKDSPCTNSANWDTATHLPNCVPLKTNEDAGEFDFVRDDTARRGNILCFQAAHIQGKVI